METAFPGQVSHSKAITPPLATPLATAAAGGGTGRAVPASPVAGGGGGAAFAALARLSTKAAAEGSADSPRAWP